MIYAKIINEDTIQFYPTWINKNKYNIKPFWTNNKEIFNHLASRGFVPVSDKLFYKKTFFDF